ncbi:HipA domain-containing protein [uncultured Algoriphagus sp.]|uniref:type II toxin-antitoxin system HipA family toxin n=1 Tax=uncultured Algoriphagus sp. TaxID=417365 RepID=UPI0025882035|nr:HipA domain-containing protein [uncultured Algoriphagus sp.]
MGKAKKDIWVYADWKEMGSPKLMGILQAELLRGKEIFSFEYDLSWLENSYSQVLDPDLQLYGGKQFLSSSVKPNFGLFLDSSPDRWGRVLMRRREAALARIEKRQEANLLESNYLLGVFDGHRMGALRFKLDPEGPFLSDNKKLASPPWASLRELEQISLKLEEDNVTEDPEYLRWLQMLLAPGSSLGGARPKASVLDKDRNLWIAKFPSKQDDFDIGGWEWVVHQLAKEAGISMAEGTARRFSSSHHTFMTKRFDRTMNGERLHFASAMTLLGYMDGQDYLDGLSYLELAEFISSSSYSVQHDLEELWRRIVFSICVSNVDDHLRNHGFILDRGGWRLSPAYDINPVETGTGLKLNISESDNSLSLELAMEVIPYFRIKEKKALEIISEVRRSVRNWRSFAKEIGISNREIELKARAFQMR